MNYPKKIRKKSLKQQHDLIQSLDEAQKRIVELEKITQELELKTEEQRLKAEEQRVAAEEQAKGAAALRETAKEQEKKAEALEIAVAELENRLKVKDAFVLSLTHEFKTPLTAILGYSSLLQGFRTDMRDAKQSLKYISSEGKRMERLALKLGGLFGLPDSEELKPETVALSFLFEQVKNVTEYLLLKHRQALILDSRTPSVYADPEMLLILLKNLVENASAASRDRTGIKITAEKKENAYRFCVEDRGNGMDEEKIKSVTEQMEQNETTRGIGLVLCARIAKAHGGSLWFESKQGFGTKAFVEIPAVSG